MSGLLDRTSFYKLIISQLTLDGFDSVAASLAKMMNLPHGAASTPSSRLESLVQAGIKAEGTLETKWSDSGDSATAPSSSGTTSASLPLDFDSNPLDDAGGGGAGLECKLTFISTHKLACRVAAFSGDGKLVATGSADTSIKLIDSARLPAKLEEDDDSKKVIRTFYDHSADVTDLQFHPTHPFVVSGSKDGTVKMFDFTKIGVKRATRALQESSPVRSIAIHASGEHLLVGTQENVIRLYQLPHFQCFAPANASDNHTGGIHQVKFSPNYNLYASSSQDGSIKLWDTVSSRCVQTFAAAHRGSEVTSLQFSRNGKYLLSGARDGSVNLLDLSTSNVLHSYMDANNTTLRTSVCFSHDEKYVLCNDEASMSTLVWNARTSERMRPFLANPIGHSTTVRYITTHPEVAGFFTCCSDGRARYWSEL